MSNNPLLANKKLRTRFMQIALENNEKSLVLHPVLAQLKSEFPEIELEHEHLLKFLLLEDVCWKILSLPSFY